MGVASHTRDSRGYISERSTPGASSRRAAKRAEHNRAGDSTGHHESDEPDESRKHDNRDASDHDRSADDRSGARPRENSRHARREDVRANDRDDRTFDVSRGRDAVDCDRGCRRVPSLPSQGPESMRLRLVQSSSRAPRADLAAWAALSRDAADRKLNDAIFRSCALDSLRSGT